MNQERLEPEAITDGLTVTILCIIPAAASSILPQVSRFNTTGNIRFISSATQSGLESLMPSILPLIYFYLNPKVRQVLKQTVEEINFSVHLFRRTSTDSIVILNS